MDASKRTIKQVVPENEADSVKEPEGYVLYGKTNAGMKPGFVELTFYKAESKGAR